jgi:VWFA-related protein
MTLYNVDPLGLEDSGGFRTTAYLPFLKGVSRADRAEAGDLALQVLATQSGGMVLNRSNDIAGSLTRCAADGDAYYVLSFAPAAADDPKDFHSLDLRVNRPGLVIRTRNGYYSRP